MTQRLAEKLPALPTDQEFSELATQWIADFIADKPDEYSFDDEGNLYFNSWHLSRKTPKVIPEDIYLDVSKLKQGDSTC